MGARCTPDVAFSNVFILTSAASKRNEYALAESQRDGLRCSLMPDMPKDYLDVNRVQELARKSTFPIQRGPRRTLPTDAPGCG
jgi:hypothetical protein